MTEDLNFDILLEINGNPDIAIYIDDEPMMGYNFNQILEYGDHTLKIVHSGKTNLTPDQFAIIKNISIDGINIDINKSVNTPIYPEPWATQQREAGIDLEQEIYGQKELYHNCTWCFNFGVPFYEFVMKDVR